MLSTTVKFINPPLPNVAQKVRFRLSGRSITTPTYIETYPHRVDQLRAKYRKRAIRLIGPLEVSTNPHGSGYEETYPYCPLPLPMPQTEIF